jgi:hypothetical protein
VRSSEDDDGGDEGFERVVRLKTIVVLVGLKRKCWAPTIVSTARANRWSTYTRAVFNAQKRCCCLKCVAYKRRRKW